MVETAGAVVLTRARAEVETHPVQFSSIELAKCLDGIPRASGALEPVEEQNDGVVIDLCGLKGRIHVEVEKIAVRGGDSLANHGDGAAAAKKTCTDGLRMSAL